MGELNQVWTNLIHNAIQATGSKGEILIETIVENTDVQVAIQDGGPGIPADVMPRIFEPFFTTKGKGEGTGLGLSISHRIIEKHGGTIRVKSEPGCTRFEVRLPIDGPPSLGPPSLGPAILGPASLGPASLAQAARGEVSRPAVGGASLTPPPTGEIS